MTDCIQIEIFIIYKVFGESISMVLYYWHIRSGTKVVNWFSESSMSKAILSAVRMLSVLIPLKWALGKSFLLVSVMNNWMQRKRREYEYWSAKLYVHWKQKGHLILVFFLNYSFGCESFSDLILNYTFTSQINLEHRSNAYFWKN